MHGHGARVDVLADAPDLIEQLVAREHLARVTSQQEEQIELLCGQAALYAIDGNEARAGLDANAGEVERRRLRQIGGLPRSTIWRGRGW